MPRGIHNLGNTCFLNTCLQILLHTYEIFSLPLELCNTNKIEAKIMEQLILFQIEMMNGNVDAISPISLLQWIKHIAQIQNRLLFTGYSQNDMSEFLLFFMDCMHICFQRPMDIQIQGKIENETDEMATQCYSMISEMYKKEYSEIKHLFYGITVSRLIDTTTDKNILQTKSESFFILDLPIDGPNLYSCLHKYVTPELLEKDNAWFNEKTQQKQDVYKQNIFWSFPPILVISLNRFYVEIENNRMMKNMHLVDFPIDLLDLSSFVHGYNPSSFQYELYGICNHMGDMTSGHYSAFVKTQQKQWFHCNDENIEIVGNENLNKMITPLAYCLFYRKKS